MLQQERQFKRDVAQKASVSEILQGTFEAAEDGTTVLSTGRQQIKRTNILATVVAKNDTVEGRKDAVVDDGTGQIRLRFFDNEAMLKKLEVGDFTTIIGRPRQYGGETYIVPEIMKNVNDVKWAEVRKLEIQAIRINAQSTAGSEESAEETVEEELQMDAVSKGKVELYRIIKELDTGRGADISAVANRFTEKSGSGNAEQMIREMLKAGDLFEVLPGRLKVLE